MQREAALKILARRLDLCLSTEALETVAAFLGDKNRHTRRAAATVSSSQTKWSARVLQGVTGRVKSGDPCVKRSSLLALRSQSALSEGMIQIVAELLNSNIASDDVESILRGHEGPYFDVVRRSSVDSIYELLLWTAFSRQWSLIVADGMSCLNTLERTMKSQIDDQQVFMARVKWIQSNGIPSMNTSAHQT